MIQNETPRETLQEILRRFESAVDFLFAVIRECRDGFVYLLNLIMNSQWFDIWGGISIIGGVGCLIYAGVTFLSIAEPSTRKSLSENSTEAKYSLREILWPFLVHLIAGIYFVWTGIAHFLTTDDTLFK